MDAVRLDQIEISDADELIGANLASIALHQPWVRPFIDRGGFDAYLESLDFERKVGLVAREVTTRAPVGVFSLSEISRGPFQSAYLGFYGLHGQTGRGLMSEALRLVVRWAFDVVGLHRVEANIQLGNQRSLNLVKRVGFRQEGYSPRYLHIDGEWRDHERWAILSDEFAG